MFNSKPIPNINDFKITMVHKTYQTKSNHLSEKIKKKIVRLPGFEPGTSRTLSGNHTTRPHDQMTINFELLVATNGMQKDAISQTFDSFLIRCGTSNYFGLGCSSPPLVLRQLFCCQINLHFYSVCTTFLQYTLKT